MAYSTWMSRLRNGGKDPYPGMEHLSPFLRLSPVKEDARVLLWRLIDSQAAFHQDLQQHGDLLAGQPPWGACQRNQSNEWITYVLFVNSVVPPAILTMRSLHHQRLL